MMHHYLLIIISSVWVLMVLGTIINFFTAPRLEKAPAPKHLVKVSLLIPARNEEENLRILLPKLNAIEYENLEILILDDQSEDGTGALLQEFISSEETKLSENINSVQNFNPKQNFDSVQKLKVIKGEPLPSNWLGKNWACAQLAEKAQGEILIFCDADVRIEPKAITATVGMMQNGRWDALTGLPKQILGTWAEKSVLPVLLFMPVLGALPLWLVSRLPMPSLSLGCGQWFAFTREMYQGMGGHAAVKNLIVEDMALGRLVKEKKGKLGAVITTEFLSVRMYTDLKSVWMGFSKNLAYLTGTGIFRPIAVMASFIVLNIFPWLLPILGFKLWLLPLSLWVTSRVLTAITFKESFWNCLWAPMGTLLIPLICFRSWWGYRKHSVTWKGRDLKAAFN